MSPSPTAPHPLRHGYYAVIDTRRDEIDPSHLWIDKGKLLYGNTAGNAGPLNTADFFVFYIECLEQREDWHSLSSIYQVWNETIRVPTSQNDNEEVNLAFNAFKSVVLNSTDLIWRDPVRLVKRLHERLEDIRMIVPSRGFMPTQPTKDNRIEGAMAETLPDVTEMKLTRKDLIQLSIH